MLAFPRYLPPNRFTPLPTYPSLSGEIELPNHSSFVEWHRNITYAFFPEPRVPASRQEYAGGNLYPCNWQLIVGRLGTTLPRIGAGNVAGLQ